MRKTLLAALAAAIGSCAPAYAQTVGEPVAVRAVCKDRALVERHIKWSQEDRNYNRANAEFLVAATAGECVGLPVGGQAVIEEIGLRSDPFVDNDGDLVRLTAIRVRGFWTMYLEVLGKEKKA